MKTPEITRTVASLPKIMIIDYGRNHLQRKKIVVNQNLSFKDYLDEELETT